MRPIPWLVLVAGLFTLAFLVWVYPDSLVFRQVGVMLR